MRIVYIANDGEEFYTKESCLAYEESRDMRDVKMLDEEKNPVDNPCHAFYVYVGTEQAYGAFRRNCGSYGIPEPERYELGCWLYDEDENGWITFIEAEEKLAKRLIELEQIRETLTAGV